MAIGFGDIQSIAYFTTVLFMIRFEVHTQSADITRPTFAFMQAQGKIISGVRAGIETMAAQPRWHGHLAEPIEPVTIGARVMHVTCSFKLAAEISNLPGVIHVRAAPRPAHRRRFSRR